jgi:uncharacterized membrane protein
MPIFFIFPIIFAIIFITALFIIISSFKKTGLKNMINAQSLQYENMELMNKLLKQKLEKGESLTEEEIAMYKGSESTTNTTKIR